MSQMDFIDALRKQVDELEAMAKTEEQRSKKLAREQRKQQLRIEHDLFISKAIVAFNEVLKESGVSSRKRAICSQAKDGLFKALKVRA